MGLLKVTTYTPRNQRLELGDPHSLVKSVASNHRNF